jgi:hypothetical protein
MQEQFDEFNSIKNYLMKISYKEGNKKTSELYKSLPISLKSLQKAIVMPTEVILDRNKPYPRAS